MLKGYTFDYQTVDAKADARLLRAIFRDQDGRLNGCEVSIAGLAGLQINAGDFIACGRHLALDETIIVPTTSCDASSEYARIRLAIDLSTAASQSEFTQASINVDGATTISGFRELITQDINNTGTTYEVEVAVVRLDNTQHIEEIMRSWPLVSTLSAQEVLL